MERINVRVDGTLKLAVGMPLGTQVTTFTLRSTGYKQTMVLRPGQRRVIQIHVSARGPWTLHLSTPTAGYVGLRAVSVRGLSPVFVRSSGATITCGVPTGSVV